MLIENDISGCHCRESLQFCLLSCDTLDLVGEHKRLTSLLQTLLSYHCGL
jgi:hypothetical protein